MKGKKNVLRCFEEANEFVKQPLKQTKKIVEETKWKQNCDDKS